MKNLFKSVSVNENFAGFVWQEQPDYNIDYKVDAKSKSLLEADLNQGDVIEIEKTRKDNISSKLSEIKNASAEDKKIMIDFIQSKINDSKYEGRIDGKEWNEIINSTSDVLKKIAATRKYTDKKNKIISSIAEKINDSDKKLEVLGKLNSLFKGIEKNISQNHDKIDWTDGDKVEFVQKNRHEKSVDSRGNIVSIPVPNGFEIKIDNKGLNGETTLIEQSGEVSSKDMDFYKGLAIELSSVFGDLRNVDFKNFEETETEKSETETTETKEKSESLLDKLDKNEVSTFVEGFKDGKINWRKGNEKLAELLKIENTSEEITKLQNELGIYGLAADGMAGTQTFARLYSKKGWEKPKTFDNPSTEQYLASWESKIDVSGEDIDEKVDITNEIKTSLGKLDIKNNFELGEPKKINGIIKTPLTIKEGDNKGTYVTVKSRNSYEFKESWGENSYVDKIFSNKKIGKVEKKSA